MIRATLLAAAVAALVAAEDRTRLRPLPDTSKNLKTGPAVGQRIPDFSLPDQSGKTRSLKDLRGPKGLVLAIVRSADW